MQQYQEPYQRTGVQSFCALALERVVRVDQDGGQSFPHKSTMATRTRIRPSCEQFALRVQTMKGVRAQIEGKIIQTVSRTLEERAQWACVARRSLTVAYVRAGPPVTASSPAAARPAAFRIFASWPAWSLQWAAKERAPRWLECRQLDLKPGTLRLEPGTTKNDEGRLVYLTPELKSLIAAQVDRGAALERQTGTIIPFSFPA
jgi:hypothetical protein